MIFERTLVRWCVHDISGKLVFRTCQEIFSDFPAGICQPLQSQLMEMPWALLVKSAHGLVFKVEECYLEQSTYWEVFRSISWLKSTPIPDCVPLPCGPVLDDICQSEHKMRPYSVNSRVQLLEDYMSAFTPSKVCHTSKMELHKGTV